MVLINLAVRYPTEHSTPYGSDTFYTLNMARSLASEGHAGWTLTFLSYFGLFPLSYPSGGIFVYEGLQQLSGLSWDSVPWIFGAVFSVLLVLGGFMLLRCFRISGSLSAALAGLMGLSPFFLFTTFGQASTRGFIVPVLVISLFVMLWQHGPMWRRLLLFSMISFALVSLHRVGLLIIVLEFLLALVVFFPIAFPRSKMIRQATYIGIMVLGIVVLFAPLITWLRPLLEAIPGTGNAYVIQWEFQSGFLFSGRSPLVLIGNLASNYVGSIGLMLLLAPFALSVLGLNSSSRFQHDLGLVIMLVMLAPYAWNTQYTQLIALPFFYLLAGLAIQRRRMLYEYVDRVLRKVRLPRPKTLISRRMKAIAVATSVILCMVFSMLWFSHRVGMTDALTGEYNWPEDSGVNLGLYVKAYGDDESGSLVTASGHLDRRLSFYSGWNCPVVDSPYLQATGYLNISPGDFTFQRDKEPSYFGPVDLFLKFATNWDIKPEAHDYNRYRLSSDVYGFWRLYLTEQASAWTLPQVSTGEANISIVVQINSMFGYVGNLYTFEGTLKSAFFNEINQNTYVLYEDNLYTANLAVVPWP